MLTTCNNLVDIIRLVARLFQQVRYSHDITILLKPCVVNLVTFLLYHHCIRLVRTIIVLKLSPLVIINYIIQFTFKQDFSRGLLYFIVKNKVNLLKNPV
jgi:hypothetical protein